AGPSRQQGVHELGLPEACQSRHQPQPAEDVERSDEQRDGGTQQPPGFCELHGNLRSTSERKRASSASNSTPGSSRKRYRSSNVATLASNFVFSSLSSTSWKLSRSAATLSAMYI